MAWSLTFVTGMVVLQLCVAQQRPFQPAQPGSQFQQGQQFAQGQQFPGSQVQPGQQFPGGQVQPGQQFPNGQVQPGQQFPGGQVQPGQQFPNGQVQPGQQFITGQLQPGQQFPGGQVQPGQQFPTGQILPGQQQVPRQGQQFVTGQPVPPGQMIPGQQLPGQQLPGQIVPGQQVPGQIVPRLQVPVRQSGVTGMPSQIPGQCVQQIQEISNTCFLTHGFQIQLVDAIITNGTVVPIPPNVNVAEQKSKLCNARTEIIQCIIPKTLNLKGKAPCSDEQEFTFAESQVVNRLSVLQTMCGAGALTPSSECLRFLKRNMQQCHVQTGFSPDMFTSNSSSVRGAIIGRDRASAAKFCGSRSDLFTCMRSVIDSCPGAQEYMLLTGYDHNSMENSIELLCGDIGVYVDGLDCFQDPPQEVTQCFDNMMTQMIELTAKQMDTTVNKDKYMDEYCRIRVEHLNCDMKGWKHKCTKASVGLKNEHECTLLPNRCQNDPTLKQALKDDVCNEKSFFKNLRGNNSAGNTIKSVLPLTVTAFLTSVLFIVL